MPSKMPEGNKANARIAASKLGLSSGNRVMQALERRAREYEADTVRKGPGPVKIKAKASSATPDVVTVKAKRIKSGPGPLAQTPKPQQSYLDYARERAMASPAKSKPNLAASTKLPTSPSDTRTRADLAKIGNAVKGAASRAGSAAKETAASVGRIGSAVKTAMNPESYRGKKK